MANEKTTNRSVKFAWPGIVVVPVKITYGTNGAITNWKGPGIVSVADGGTGIATITLAHGYAGGCVGLLGHSREGAASTAHLFPIVTTDNSDSTGSAPTVSITLTAENGTATDPTSTDVYTYFLAFDELNMVQTVTP